MEVTQTALIAAITLLLVAFAPIAFGVQYINGWEVYTSIDGLGSDFVYCVLVADDGTKWFGTEGGLSKFDDTIFNNYLVDPAGSTDENPNTIRDMTLDSEDRLWVASYGGGARCFLGDHFTDRIDGDGLVSLATSVIMDGQGNLWVGSVMWVGRYRFAEGEWDLFNEFSLLSGGDHVNAFARGQDGPVWVATYKKVCAIWENGQRWEYFRPNRGCSSDIAVLSDGRKLVTGMVPLPEQELKAFIGVSQDGAHWTEVEPEFGPYAWLLCATPTTSGAVWFGTRGGALLYDGGTWRWIDAWYNVDDLTEPDDYHGAVKDIAVGSNGDVWFATSGCGVGVLRGGVADRPPVRIDLAVDGNAPMGDVEVTIDAAFEMRLTLDFYLAVQATDGTLMFAPDFTFQLAPLVSGISVSGRQRVTGLPVLSVETQGLPAGTYRWYAACTHAGTMEFASNIASCEWQFE